MFRKPFLRAMAVLVIVAAAPSFSLAEMPAPKSAEEDIQKALTEPTQMVFTETALSDVIDFLKDLHKQKHPCFEIVLDTKALNDVSITPEMPVTKNLKGISLRSALRLLLNDLNLTYIIRDEVLLITTPEVAENAICKKLYDVADLISPEDRMKGNAFESLIDMVAKTANINAKDKKKGPGWIASIKTAEIAAIVVCQSDEAQSDVADLLAQLRKAKHPKPTDGN